MKNLIPMEYKQQRVLITAQLAEAYGTDSIKIQQNFNNNKSRYKEGKHYFLLEGEALRQFKDDLENFEVAPKVNKLYLWTEKGAWLHAKSLNTDRVWEAYEMLIDEYYRVREDANKAVAQSIEDILITQLQSMKELRIKQEQQSEEIKLIKAKIENSLANYFTIVGYTSFIGLKVDNSIANWLGKKASKLSRERGIWTGKVSDPRFGKVNTYHLDVLREVFL